ncbi:hypothetical protein BOX15_Mlig009225g1 [Macrostomum lignano]|uniref:Ubiquitin-like domain-containing protein n=1 Tax=Macrostomum lignano TaxID=282301 RepID=A0A267H4B7_9PLAT|nr:hypothetical protein BOX15_Mlig019646g2 [Macrostomum lignano]PAA93128.1 hypothetical protein BOX15_Mlig009225g1 [Macrostomum lignano]
MDVYFMIRCKKVTMLLDTKETSQVLELKKMIEGILKVSPENQQLVKDETEVLLDNRTLADCGLNASTARAQLPAVLGLVIRDSPDAPFPPLDIEPYTSPPELPDVMKAQDSSGGDQGMSTQAS